MLKGVDRLGKITESFYPKVLQLSQLVMPKRGIQAIQDRVVVSDVEVEHIHAVSKILGEV